MGSSSQLMTTSLALQTLDDGSASANSSTSSYDYEEDYADPEARQMCELYNFIMYAVIGGLLCILGCIGNILAFIVFWCDKVKTSTSLLFQVCIAPPSAWLVYSVYTSMFHTQMNIIFLVLNCAIRGATCFPLRISGHGRLS